MGSSSFACFTLVFRVEEMEEKRKRGEERKGKRKERERKGKERKGKKRKERKVNLSQGK